MKIESCRDCLLENGIISKASRPCLTARRKRILPLIACCLSLLGVGNLIAIPGITNLPPGYPDTPRRKISLNQDWRFHLGELPDAPHAARYDDSGWENVCVPHTFKLTSLGLDGSTDNQMQKTFQRDVGWYRRTLKLEKIGVRKIFLEFEGAHQVTDLWVNGKHVGQHAIGGYTPFHFDVTKFVRTGDNVIALRLDNRVNENVPPDPGPFDYIKFSGLYRDVYLVETDPVYVTFPWEALRAGVRVTTPTVDPLLGNATIAVQTTVRNAQSEPRDCRVLTRVIDANNEVVLHLETVASVAAGADHTFDQTGGITENLRLWSCDDPYLYRVNTTVFIGDRAVDCVENPLGIRKFELNRHDGLLLNGKPLKLLGVNRHQHYAYIGDALPDSLHFKDALQIKQAGFNIVRLAHYPHDDAFLDACDTLGLLVYEEAPTWIGIGGAQWFDNLERSLRRAIRNHRNHPSAIMWGGGINHRGAVERLHYAAKEEDPTRWTASNNSAWTGAQDSGVCDIYSNMDYERMDEFKGEEHLFAMESGSGNRATVSQYKGDPMRLGFAAWTAHAYYTFHESFKGTPEDRTRSGILDIFRASKPTYEWYRVELATNPVVRIVDDWTNGVKEVRVNSNCDEVELLVNGNSLGRRNVLREGEFKFLNCPPFAFPIEKFDAGELVAHGFRNGQLVAEDKIRTPETPAQLMLTVDLDGREFTADGADIVVAYARVLDRNGTLIRDGRHAITFVVTGAAGVVGDGAGIGANPIRSKNGVAAALVRAGRSPGEITLRAEAEGLRPAVVKFRSVPTRLDRIAASARPIFDLRRVRVDIGGVGQLVQFDWTEWTGKDNEAATFHLPAMVGRVTPCAPLPEAVVISRVRGAQRTVRPAQDVPTVTLRAGSAVGVTRWLGEMNVIGRNGYVVGDGACVIDDAGLVLEFSGLPAGRYRLKTFHHAPQSNTDLMDPNRERLKTAKLWEVAAAARLALTTRDAAGEKPRATEIEVTAGKKLSAAGPGVAVTDFVSDGKQPVTLRFRSARGHGRAVWLNGFELGERP